MSTTARDIISASLSSIGVLAEGETPSAESATLCFNRLNDLIDSWSNESLLIINFVRETFALTTGQKSYTIGTGGDFNTARPMEIESALIQITSTNPTMDLGLEILNLDQYNAIPIKDTQSSLPRRLYYDNAYPLGTISFYPVPDTTLNVVISSKKPLTSFATLDTISSVAPGFLRALRSNLAVEVAPEFEREASPTVQRIAAESKASVKRRAKKPDRLVADPALVSRGYGYNIYTGGVK